MMHRLRESGIRDLSSLRSILVVDDQQDAADLLAMVLTEHGHRVEVAHDGESALELARAFRPQIALLDLGLPGMDGYQLAALLLATPTLTHCRLIAVSGHCTPQDRERSKATGFSAHLAKPVSIDTLLLAIDDCGRELATELPVARSKA
jgi:two-component system, chemotaxis family, CheB/CheR fusion protein